MSGRRPITSPPEKPLSTSQGGDPSTIVSDTSPAVPRYVNPTPLLSKALLFLVTHLNLVSLTAPSCVSVLHFMTTEYIPVDEVL